MIAHLVQPHASRHRFAGYAERASEAAEVIRTIDGDEHEALHFLEQSLGVAATITNQQADPTALVPSRSGPNPVHRPPENSFISRWTSRGPLVPILGACAGIRRHLVTRALIRQALTGDMRLQIASTGKCFAMIRVTKTEELSLTLVTIDGQLRGDSIAIVETCCKDAKASGKPVQLFLRDINVVDQAGELLLSRLAGEGIRLSARGVYTSHLVQSVALASNSRARAARLRVDGEHN